MKTFYFQNAKILGSYFFSISTDVDIPANFTSFANIMQLVNDQKFTLQFHQPQRYCDDFWRIISALEETFQALVGANIYWTPKNTQGLAPHWDAIDAFVIQVRYSHFLGVQK